ncbi:MAG TPA: AAA domain-containing protein [Kofleriaceae bacterium]|nr:AAA domain-containing protein [Kofleriaceae bacterium]
MKVSEVAGGVTTTLRVRAIERAFQPLPEREQEVSLSRSGGQTLLAWSNDVWAIQGSTPADTPRLTDVVVSGLPVLAYVAQAASDALVVETRRLTQELRITEPVEIGVDEKVLEDVRRSHRVGGTVADVAAWLQDRLFVPPTPGGPAGLHRLVISGDARGRLDAFRIHGFRIAADVRRVNDRLRVERVLRGGQGGNLRLILLYVPISIVDATAAAALHGAVRTTLSEAVSGSSSYLRTWQEYHRLERETVLRRARTFGALAYRTCERRRDGGWRFHLAPLEDLGARLALLGGWDRFELEAGAALPVLAEDTPRKSAARVQRLSAPVVHVDEHKHVVDLAPPDEDGEHPKPPTAGYLYLSLGGDEARLRRRARAEEALRTGNCPLPQLGLLMEGRPAPAARRGRISVDGPKLRPVIREVFGAAGPTQRQIEAIEIALNTPDVCLIQGPPGTGKTKVITAIEQCLAVLADEGIEPSHRILVTAAQHDAVENVALRTEVFGLPAVKVGQRRRGSDTSIDPAQVFAEERVEELRARMRIPPEAERLSRARGLALACIRTRALPREQAERIHDLVHALDGLLPPDLRDKAMERAASLRRPPGLEDPERAELLVRAARGIRVEAGAFSDDGPLQARKALLRLDALLTSEERAFLVRCAELPPEQVPPWLAEGHAHRDAIVDRLTRPPPAAEPRLDDDTQRLLLEILDTVDRRRAAGRAGSEAVLAAYVNDLETDLEGVRKALEHYTVVLASTLQHAAGNEMRRVRGIDEGQTTFESVIVDEAARANPLDLFIPLSMARRRAVLVGDHRQLPHHLEPDVERQLAEGVDQGTVEAQTLQAVRASLFERLWVLLRALEQKDGIQRTVTLNAQYRMHPVLGSYVSRAFYEVHEDGSIESPRRAAEFPHDLPGYVKHETPCAAAWLDVPGDRGREVRGVSKSRPAEARALAKEVRRLIEHAPTLTFGVIAFYSAQVDEIGRAMLATGLTEPANNVRGWRIADAWATTYNAERKKVERLRIGTVDAFQGKEFDVVFLSVTRSNDLPGQTDEQQRRKYGHLMLENRLCVAMSRQQRMLAVVGDLAFVKADDAARPLRALRAYVDLCGGEHGIVR